MIGTPQVASEFSRIAYRAEIRLFRREQGSIDDSVARADWGWRPEYDLSRMTKEMLDNLKKNDEVITTSGIHGTVAIIKEKSVVLRVDEGCRIEFDRESIASVTSGEVKPEVVK